MAEPIAERPNDTARLDTQDTVPIPPVVDAGATQTILIETPPPRRHRRWVGWVIALVILVLLGIVAWIVGDSLARSYATTYIRDEVVQLLGVEDDEGVEVEIAPGSVLAQAITGSIDGVTVRVDEVSFGELTGALVMTGANIPLDDSQPTEELRAEFSVTEANVGRIASFLSGAQLDTIELDAPEIRITSEFSFFGLFAIPVGVGLTPSAVDGEIAFEPTSVRFGEEDITADELRNGDFGGLVGAFLTSQSFCVAQYLPQALLVTDADVAGKNLVILIEADGTALGDPSLTTMGTCE